MACRSWLAHRVLGLCMGLVVMSPQAVLAQLPNCEPFPHSKTDSPDPVNQGNDVTYTITLASLLEPTCFLFDDPLPANTTFQSLLAPGWTCTVPPVGSNGTVHCSIGPTGPQVLTLVVRVDPDFSGTCRTSPRWGGPWLRPARRRHSARWRRRRPWTSRSS